MAVIFSIDSPDVYLEVKTDEPLHLKRRVVSIETLEGTDSRDFGGSASDLAFAIDTLLSESELGILADAVESGAKLGLSLSKKSYSILIKNVEARRSSTGLTDVKIEIVVTGEIG